MVRAGQGRRVVSVGGWVDGIEPGHNPFPGGDQRTGDLNEPGPRHVALHRRVGTLWVYYSSIGDVPERILRARGRVIELRDPAIFEDDDGRIYLLYSAAGESGIAIAELTFL